MAQADFSMKQKFTEQTCGCQGGDKVGRKELGVWD